MRTRCRCWGGLRLLDGVQQSGCDESHFVHLNDVAMSPNKFKAKKSPFLTNEGPLVAIDWIGILLKNIITNRVR